jgi:PAS domain S-box-containing protein
MDNQYGEAAFEGDAPVAASETALPDRRELALVAVERTRMPMVITDPRKPDNPIVLANQAFLDLTGYEASEVVGRNCRFLQGPDTDPKAIEALRGELRSDDEELLKTELLNYRKDGSSFWNELAISAVHDEHGELIYYFA